MGMGWGILAATASSGLGGTSIAATRYLRMSLDPLAIGTFRFGIGGALLILAVLLRGTRWPPRKDWPAIVGLGLLFFGLFPILFNAALVHTTAARGSLALATLPVLTMLAAALLGVEPLTGRKTLGVLTAIAGVGVTLLGGQDTAPAGAWRGDLLMIGAALCMALYSIGSRPYIARSDPIAFTAVGMVAGAATLATLAAARGSLSAALALDAAQGLAVGYLGLVGGALTFFLWSAALGRATPTQVALSVTVNPISASLVGLFLLGEPAGWPLVAGIAAVFAGIWIAAGSGGPGTAAEVSRNPNSHPGAPRSAQPPP